MEVNKLGLGAPEELGPIEEWPIGRLFAAAARMTGPMMWRLIERHGVSPAGFFVLRILHSEDGLRAGEVARRLMTSPASATSVIGTLERNGHVERRRDEADRRAVRLHITEAGSRLIAATIKELGPDIWEFYDVVPPEDEPAVRRFLLALIDKFDDCTDPNGERT
ncbi:putative HTH-type transcriptional regulator YusO [Actinomadura rubteroloni]|uniref:Putative HTH-type transcriptional regulator YusO n=1 Tax=Actinomadura rubteroloni TaxID=1926885 RepID=A0A2P4UDX9_9ACTN|nr:MarR family transcriptional regulator [Actinomadura rubteroloni]POM23255.1 putative HTH-type transcriptional regulator YusO [Actinomadura rubteroloni]